VAINLDDAFDVRAEGFAVRDNDGNPIFYITTGIGDPTGSPAPVNTFYIDQSTQLLYYKFGAGNNDWRQIRAQDIAFDNSVADYPNNPQNLQAALEEARGARFQYIQFQKIGQMNFDQYLIAGAEVTTNNIRRSGDASNGYQFGNSAPQTVAFSGNVKNATASVRGIAQSTGTPAANLSMEFELWKVGFNNEGTKLGDIVFDVVSANYTIGNWWNSSIVTAFAEEQPQDVDVTAGDLLGLKFNSQTGNNNVVSIENTTVVLEITGNA
jgi:hypothetical protein